MGLEVGEGPRWSGCEVGEWVVRANRLEPVVSFEMHHAYAVIGGGGDGSGGAEVGEVGNVGGVGEIGQVGRENESGKKLP